MAAAQAVFCVNSQVGADLHNTVCFNHQIIPNQGGGYQWMGLLLVVLGGVYSLQWIIMHG